MGENSLVQGSDPEDIRARLSRLEASIMELERRLEKVEHAMYGGSDDMGVLSRLAVIESKIEQLSEWTKWSIVFTAGTFLGIIITIVALVVKGGP